MATVSYYNQYAEQFYQAMYQVDMHSLYQDFLQHLPPDGNILDLGCGSGRDVLTFKQLGFEAGAIDASPSLVERAQQLIGLNVRGASFNDLSEIDKYHGIWGCASVLHCERQRLSEVLGKIITASKTGGVCYMSFKYGSTDREQEGHYFIDLDDAQATALLQPFFQIELLKQWITTDQRPERSEQWLNILFRKHGYPN